MQEEQEQQEQKTFIFVDGSYYCFYRYYALLQWWKNAYPEEPLEDPMQHEKFVEKYKKTFVDNLRNIPKKLELPFCSKPTLFVGKDCKREDIWRTELFPEYKGHRIKEDGFMGGPFFQMAYEDNLFLQGGATAILEHPRLEADDCIALSVQHLAQKYPHARFYIIANDRDYLQLNGPQVSIFTLAYKNIAHGKTATGDASKDLRIKILMGDVSDNIPSVFPKCGIKTAIKCIEQDDFFQKKMKGHPEYEARYRLNKTLVSFDKIPREWADAFLKTFVAEIKLN